MAEENSFLKRFFVPRYNELSIALMSAAFLMIFFTNQLVREEVIDFTFDDLRMIIFAGVCIIGISLSFYHIFTNKKKNKFEKYCMLIFALAINAYSGIAAGIHILNESKGFFMIFPIWNIFNAALLIILFRADVIKEDSITDENTNPMEFLFGLAIMSVLFFVCQYIFNLYWAITFSICITYVTNFNKILNIFHPLKTSNI